MNRGDVTTLIETSLQSAHSVAVQAGENVAARNAQRARNFVDALAKQLKTRYEQPGYRVLWRQSGDNRTDFGLNELLYDIAVLDTAVTPPIRGMQLHYVKSAICLVECEFARDSKKALHDFNKLVIGEAEHKLFVGPLVDDVEAFFQVLDAPARHCSGRVFVALVAHPDDWDDVSLTVDVRELPAGTASTP